MVTRAGWWGAGILDSQHATFWAAQPKVTLVGSAVENLRAALEQFEAILEELGEG